MFKVGDKIVYPMHGGGFIDSLEEKDILGAKTKCYILKFLFGTMKVMIPMEKIDDIGVRHIVAEDILNDVVLVLASEPTPMDNNWNRRYRENTEKLKTGDILEVSEVVKNLFKAGCKKNLSAGEKKMLDTAFGILQSEIILVKNITEDEAKTFIKEPLGLH